MRCVRNPDRLPPPSVLHGRPQVDALEDEEDETHTNRETPDPSDRPTGPQRFYFAHGVREYGPGRHEGVVRDRVPMEVRGTCANADRPIRDVGLQGQVERWRYPEEQPARGARDGAVRQACWDSSLDEPRENP